MRLALTFYAFWHVGTGRGDGPECDAIVRRSDAGLPIVPGRTIAGLCREACQTLEGVRRLVPGRTEELFGTWSVPGPEASNAQAGESEAQRLPPPGTARFDTKPGVLDFRTARLGETYERQRGWEQWADGLGSSRDKVDTLYQALAATKIDEQTGTAEAKTLRSIEVAVPLTLYGFVDALEELDASWCDDLALALPLIRSLGLRRHRGLGRVALRLESTQPR